MSEAHGVEQCHCDLIEGTHRYTDCVPLLNQITLAWSAQQEAKMPGGYPLEKEKADDRTK